MSRLKRTPAPTYTLQPRWRVTLPDHVIALAWSPDGCWLAAAAVSGPLVVVEAATGAVHARCAGHTLGSTSLAWSATSTTLASTGQDGQVRLWDVSTGQEHGRLEAGAAWGERVAWTPDGTYLAAAAGRFLRLWDQSGCLVHAYPAHASSITDIAWGPSAMWPEGNGPVLASATYGGITLWTPATAEPVHRLPWKGSILTLAWSPHGRYLAHGDQDATVHFWNLATGKDAQMWGYPTKVRDLAWDATGRYLATGGGTGVVVWDFAGEGPQGSKPLVLEAHRQFLSALAFQHGGPWLASGGLDALCALWHPGQQKRALAQQRLPAAATQAQWAPDDQTLALGCADGTLIAYAVTT